MSEEISHGALAERIDSAQRELTEFKTESRKHRDKIYTMVGDISKDTDEIKEYMREQRADTKAYRKIGKIIIWVFGLVASGVGIYKGIGK